MLRQFTVEWLDGPAASLLRRRRPGVDELPWGTLDLSLFTPAAQEEARKVWTNGCFTEYASGAAFSALAGALLECGAPIDLVAAAADFAVDEMSHAEMAARLVMELGGAVPYEAELEKVSPYSTPGVSPLLRAAELVIKVSSVGEALSVPVLAASRKVADQALPRAILQKLSHDEGPHAALSDWFFGWARPRLSSADRDWLAGVALDAIAVYAPLWQRPACAVCTPVPAVGGITHDRYQEMMIAAVQHRIARPLARHEISLYGPRFDSFF